MDRKRCSLKKGLREGTAKMMVQPPEPDLSPAMAAAVVVSMASYIYALYTQVRVLHKWH